MWVTHRGNGENDSASPVSPSQPNDRSEHSKSARPCGLSLRRVSQVETRHDDFPGRHRLLHGRLEDGVAAAGLGLSGGETGTAEVDTESSAETRAANCAFNSRSERPSGIHHHAVPVYHLVALPPENPLAVVTAAPVTCRLTGTRGWCDIARGVLASLGIIRVWVELAMEVMLPP